MKQRIRRGFALPQLQPVRIHALALGLCLVLFQNACAFEYPLQPEQVREAYYLGLKVGQEELADFLKQYRHDFQYPSDSPIAFVQSVEFQTPYEQVVLRTQRTIGYSKFQADEDYQTNPGLIIVRVVVSLKNNYSGPAPPVDSFKVAASQVTLIKPRKVTSTVLCNPFNPYDVPTLASCAAYTQEILLQFDTAQFAPGRATVKVMLPFGHSMETIYNLNKLK